MYQDLLDQLNRRYHPFGRMFQECGADEAQFEISVLEALSVRGSACDYERKKCDQRSDPEAGLRGLEDLSPTQLLMERLSRP